MEIVKVKLKPGHPDRAMNIRLKDGAVVRINEQGIDLEAERIDAADLRRLAKYLDVEPMQQKKGKGSASEEPASDPNKDPKDKKSKDEAPATKEKEPKSAAKTSKAAKSAKSSKKAK